ncbi:cytochrome C oxidase subunit II [Chitinophaga oryziterrae]|uniref:Cytochrome C oxidase subunit II n=1 Tax=Chitinophaga oryziterrae TaxID=1031224 RepID=A0A6N8JGC4_9BACT|nr:cytochrome c oxidase subunit II [Chitinophaga oryziterrae]MVT43551.1 cytochrome C oxidase subunit II [Chitinophaga oryziterrae]
MNKYEIKTILLSSSVMAVFFFAILYNAFARKIDVPACIPYNATFRQSAIKKVDDTHYEVYIIARMWAFDPAEIIVPAGSTVDFYLTSADVVHGFNIERKGVNLMAIPGAVNKTTVNFTDYGTYRIVCHEYCGAGHHNMMAQVLVTYLKK